LIPSENITRTATSCSDANVKLTLQCFVLMLVLQDKILMFLEKEFIVLTGKVYQGFLNIFAEIGSDSFTNFA